MKRPLGREHKGREKLDYSNSERARRGARERTDTDLGSSECLREEECAAPLTTPAPVVKGAHSIGAFRRDHDSDDRNLCKRSLAASAGLIPRCGGTSPAGLISRLRGK